MPFDGAVEESFFEAEQWAWSLGESAPHVRKAVIYCLDVHAGLELTCQETKAACRRQLRDLTRWLQGDPAWPHVFDVERAERFCRFVELLPHTKGRWAAKRELLKLEPWQCFIGTTLFGWMTTGLHPIRRFREAYVEVARKNGKSLFCAAVGIYGLCADNEFGAEIFCGATTEKQAWEVFRPARLICLNTPKLVRRFGIEINAKNINIARTGGRFEPLIGNPGDGPGPHIAIVDEYHEHKDSGLYDTMKTGMGAREQPLLFVITTAGTNQAGPCYLEHLSAKQLLAGNQDLESKFAVIYSLDPEDAWNDPAVFKKANPNLNVSVTENYLNDMLAEAVASPEKQNIFQTKNLNRWVGATVTFLNQHTWKTQAPERASLKDLMERGRSCVLTMDLAAKYDLAVLLQVFAPTIEDPIIHVFGNYYLPAEVVYGEGNSGPNQAAYRRWAELGILTTNPGAVLDYDMIEGDARTLLGKFDVTHFTYDPWHATQLATSLAKDGAPMVEVNANVPNFSEPMKALKALILQGRLAHGGCPVLSWMAGNLTAAPDKKENVYPRKEHEANKIDGMVALIMALSQINTFVQTKNLYNERGLLVVG